ncbi:hypothetical protein [Salinigranum sp. GCM10025319]|uniref:hypothetical protein n=1 Tax=Salinigranum sp. GCM10025319 TaxID=3252687 RepID=UPI003609A589
MSANTTGDEYRRGREAEARQHRQPTVNPLYRPIILVVWAIGLVIALVTTLFAAFPETTFWVVLVSHLFLAGLVRQDIKSIRTQGVEWGLSRHVWFAATLVFPLVAPAYYLYSGRVVSRENERRRRRQEVDAGDGDGGGADADDGDEQGDGGGADADIGTDTAHDDPDSTRA